MYHVCMKGWQRDTERSDCCRPRLAAAVQLAEGRAQSRRPCNRGSAAAGCIVSILLTSSCAGWWQLVRFLTPQDALSASSDQAAVRPGGSHAPRGFCSFFWVARDALLPSHIAGSMRQTGSPNRCCNCLAPVRDLTQTDNRLHRLHGWA